MKDRLNWKEKLRLNRTVKQKCNYFHENGYKSVKEEDIWQYLLEYRWKRHVITSIHEKKKDILAISFNDYFDYQRIQAQTQGPEEFDWENIHDVL